MPINQIFKTNVPEKLILNILLKLNINNFTDNHGFTYKIIEENKDNIILCLNDIKPYYLPCKCKIYFDNIDSKKIITILRQLLKLYNYTLKTKEKYCRMSKTKYTEFYIKEKIEPEKPHFLLSFF
jgi:hypothetical protein|tara:strand:- start:313 stop:687 length:375 start_codon:yes stop_codon:yes gene_type:complete